MPSRRSPLAALFVTVFLDLLGFGMIIPILALYAKTSRWHDGSPVSDTAVMTLNSIYSLMQLIFAPIWGRISDRYGRRPVLLVSIAGSCISQFGYASATSFEGLLIARGFAGVCGANIAAAQAYIADSTDEKSRAAGLGLMGVAFGLGFVFGPAFGGLLAPYGHNVPFYAASALSLGNVVLAWFTLSEPRPAGERTASRAITWDALVRTVTSRASFIAILLFFLVTFAFSQLESTFPLHLHDRFGFGERDVGWVFTGIGIVTVLTQGVFVRRFATRLGERTLVIIGTSLMTAGMLLLAVAHGYVLLTISCICVAAGSGMNQPSISSLISRSAAGDRQGGVLGVAQSFSALARILGPQAGGILRGFGTGVPYAGGGLLMGGAVIYTLLLVAQPVDRSTVAAIQVSE